MTVRPLEYLPRAVADLAALAPDLRPAVLEFLSRVAADAESCSRPTAFPRPPGLMAGLWCRYPTGGAALVEVLFELAILPDRVVVRRVVVTEMARLPGWVVNPAEWGGERPWPVVEL